MPLQKIANRPYCRDCFSKRRRKITNGFMKLEDEISKNGQREGLTNDQIEEIQVEIREKLKKRLERLDQEFLGKQGSIVVSVG